VTSAACRRLVVFVALTALAGPGATVLANGPTPEAVLEDAARFDDYTAFHLDRAYGGHPLTGASRSRDAVRRQPTFGFIYGTCEPEPDAGCAPPYEIQNYAICSRNPAVFPRGARGRRHPPIRGATVRAWSEPGVFDRLEVYTGATTVVVFAPNRRGAARAVRALQSADGKVAPRERLRPPIRGALVGRRRC
jgi:hypothetical protein